MKVKAIHKESGKVVSVTFVSDDICRNCDDTNISYRRDELLLFDFSGVWNFIETWHPNYYHSDLIAWIDDLHCALDNECDDEKLARIKETWGNTPSSWLTELINLETAAYSRALARYYELQYPNVKF